MSRFPWPGMAADFNTISFLCSTTAGFPSHERSELKESCAKYLPPISLDQVDPAAHAVRIHDHVREPGARRALRNGENCRHYGSRLWHRRPSGNHVLHARDWRARSPRDPWARNCPADRGRFTVTVAPPKKRAAWPRYASLSRSTPCTAARRRCLPWLLRSPRSEAYLPASRSAIRPERRASTRSCVFDWICENSWLKASGSVW